MTRLGKVKQFFLACDLVLVVSVLFLCAFGVVVLGSIARNASPAVAAQAQAAFSSQIVWFASGIAVLLLVSLIDYQFICKFYILFVVLTIGLLVLVLFIPPLRENFPRRWLHIPNSDFSPTVQPAEFAKIFMIIFFAKYIEKMHEKINNKLVILSMLAIGLLPVTLIFIQPSFSTSILQLVIVLVMIFMSGIKYRFMVIALVIVLPLLLFFYYDLTRDEHLLLGRIFEPFQIDRFRIHLGIIQDPNLMHQGDQSVHAIGTGRMLGRGLFGNVIAVPLAHNDFIFAIIAAEFGFLGSVAVIGIIFLIVFKCFRAAHLSNSLSGRLLAAGVGAMIGTQAFVHIGVTTQLLPNTGIPLPFVSAGGSSMWINLAAIGLVLNVGMKPARHNIFLDG